MNRRQFLSRSSATVAAATLIAVPSIGCAAGDLDKALQMVNTGAIAVDSIVSVLTTASGLGYLTPALLAATDTVLAEIKLGLQTVSGFITAQQATPSASKLDDIDTALTAIQDNIAQALTIAHITDAATQAVYVGTVGLLKSAVSLIQTLIPAAPTASSFRKASQIKYHARKVAAPSADQFVNLFNAVLVNSPYADAQIK